MKAKNILTQVSHIPAVYLSNLSTLGGVLYANTAS